MQKSETENNPIAPALPSASVILVRDNRDQLEVLLVQRNAKIKFHGGAWVFPGGKVDEADHLASTDAEEINIARAAATREAQEEVGVTISPHALHAFSHWLTPIQLPKRFSTWFFITPLAADTAINIDASEIVDHVWLTPAAALEQQAAAELTLPGPTYVTLLKLQELAATTHIEPFITALGFERFAPRVVENEHGRIALYHGDAGFEDVDINAEGARHRLNMLKSGWQYEKLLGN